MDIRKQLLADHSKENTNLIVNYIGNHQEHFHELLNLFLHDEYRVTQRAAWVIGELLRKQPHLIDQYLSEFILNLKKPKLHDAVKRNTLRVLQEIKIPEALWGETADICFKFLTSNQEPTAIKVFAMTVLYNITKSIPELQEELKIIIEDQMPYGSAGFKSRGNKILKEINKAIP